MNNFYVDDEYNLLIAGDTTSFADIDSKDAFIIRVPLNDIGENEIKNTYIQNSEVTYSIEGMDLELSDKKYSIETEEHDYKIFDYPFKVENIKERDIHIKDILN